jgi:HK97 family phage major capsid protein
MAMSGTTTGGFLVPYAFDPTIIAIGVHNTINPYRQACRTIDVVGSNIWHGLTSTAVTAVRGVEALVAAEAAPAFAQPSFTPSRVETQVTYSIEVAQDRPDIGDEMAILIQEAKDNEEEATFSVGTGATTMLNCVGMVAPKSTSGGWTISETASNSAITEADLNKFELALPVRFRKNAAWFLGRKTIRYIQALETAYGTIFNAAGMYPSPGYPAVGNPDLNDYGNTGLKIKGYPVYESFSIPVTLTTQLAWGAFCDPKTFVIVDRVGMDVEFIPVIFGSGQGNMATGQRALYAYWRNACGPVTVLGGLNLTMVT